MWTNGDLEAMGGERGRPCPGCACLGGLTLPGSRVSFASAALHTHCTCCLSEALSTRTEGARESHGGGLRLGGAPGQYKPEILIGSDGEASEPLG